MSEGNGVKATLDHHRDQIDRLWENKASKEALNNVATDVAEIRDDVRKMREGLEARQHAQASERKSNIRWLVGTALVAVGLVLTGMALILPYLVGPT